MSRPRPLRPRLAPLARGARRWLALPEEPALRAWHGRTLLVRTERAGLVLAGALPLALLAYGAGRGVAVGALLPAALGLGGVALALAVAVRVGAFRRAWHLPGLLLVALACAPAQALALRLGGAGAAPGEVLFPAFLVLFAIATLFPAHGGWALLALACAPASALAAGAARAQVLLLAEAALVAWGAHRFTTRLFFREAEHRLALEQANRQLREQDRVKTEFFAGLSHDLRSPLTTIVGPLSLLRAEAERLGPQPRYFLELAVSSAVRLEAMVNDILELARLDAGVRQLRRAQTDVRRLVAELVEANRPYAEGLGLTLELSASERPLVAAVDADKLERVVMNLLSNACKFSGVGGRVRVRLAEEGWAFVLEVGDEGLGIAPEDLPHLFTRFARGQGARRTRGAGLGLSVVKEFVELHGGQVAVHSVLGQGTTFTVVLPRQVPGAAGTEPAPPSPEPRPAEPPGASAAPPPLAVLRPRAAPPTLGPAAPAAMRDPAPARPILVLVEDSAEVRRFVAALLQDAWEVQEAASAEAALSLVRAHPPALLVTDLMLPGMDGLAFVRALREAPATRALPVLAFSARGGVEPRLEAFDAGADDFLHKPFDPRELRARLARLTGSRAPRGPESAAGERESG